MEVQKFKVDEVKELNGNPTELMNVGLMKTQSAYTTSMQVIKPRNINSVEKKCIEEAVIAGEEFIYQWPVNKKTSDGRTKKEQLIGLSVGAALAIARNMGNNAIDVEVEERPDSYVFYGAYIDLETGFNLRRAYRQRKEQRIGDKYKGDGRAEDIIFQIGQSKAIRNVALNAAPSWLTKKVQEAALSSFGAKVIDNPGEYKGKCLELAKKLFIPLERIELKYGKESGWDSRKIISLFSELRTIEDGYDDMENVFPDVKSEKVAIEGNTTKSEAQIKQDNQLKPEVESVKVEEKKAIILNVEEWENPQKVIEAIESIPTAKELNEFKKQNKGRIQSFGGRDHESIYEALLKAEYKLK